MRCPRCSVALTRRLDAAVVMACPSCRAVLDLSVTPPGVIAQQEKPLAHAPAPIIPVGRAGSVQGRNVTCVGYVQRRSDASGISEEYVLRDVNGGVRWLVHEQDEWCLLKPGKGSGEATAAGFGGIAGGYAQRDVLFRTTFVAGELPVRLAPGHEAKVSTFVHGDGAITTIEVDAEGERCFWGRELAERVVWRSFGMRPRSIADIATAAFFLLVIVQISSCMLTSRRPLIVEELSFSPDDADRARVTAPFELKHRSALELEVDAPVQNEWVTFGLALVSESQSKVIERVVEVEQWSGYDDEGSWSEGGPRKSTIVPSVPAGVWRLRVEPRAQRTSLAYAVRVRRANPRFGWLVVALLALLPAGWLAHVSVRRRPEADPAREPG
jgi:hypothetical protein